MYDAAMDADVLMLVTEWKEFRMPDWRTLRKIMKQPLIFDGRNIYDREELWVNGFGYYCIG